MKHTVGEIFEARAKITMGQRLTKLDKIILSDCAMELMDVLTAQAARDKREAAR